MTRDEYLENHDEREGAENTFVNRTKRCPICGNEECEVYAIRDGEIVGCDCCLCRVRTADLDWLPHVPCVCGADDVEEIYLRHEDGLITEIVGCDRCVREVEKWRWEAKI